MLLSDASVVVPGQIIEPGWVRIESGRITAIGAGTPPPLQPGEAHTALLGDHLLPGFIDLHVHGGGGSTFAGGEPAEVAIARRFHLANGTTRSLASLATAPLADLLSALSALADVTESGLIAGIHLEGPFLSPVHRGAHDPRYLLPPDHEVLSHLLAAGRGSVKMVTVAPELSGAIDLIRQIVDAGAIAAIGHSDATYAVASSAIDAGASVATHLFNGMRPMHQREPGIVGAALDRADVTCELIVDGRHLHPATVRLGFSMASERIALVTDASSAAGAGDGRYQLGSMWIEVRDGEAHLESSDTIASSTITTGGAVRRLVLDTGLPLPAVAHAASAVPARLLHLENEVGTIEVGRVADLVVLDRQLHLRAVMTGGEWHSTDLTEREFST